MTKNEFKDIVKQGFFSCRWIKNDGKEGHIKLGVLGKLGYRFTKEKQVTEHPNYVLVFRINSRAKENFPRWANVNPDTVFEINQQSYTQ
jgi:hypothetical protein